MNEVSVDARSVRAAWWLATGALAAGVLYYACMRAGHPPRALAWLLDPPVWGGTVLDPTAGTLPSFLHGLAVAAVAVALGGRRGRRLSSGVAGLTVAFVLEWHLGTPDPLDALALLIGAALAPLVLLRSPSGESRDATRSRSDGESSDIPCAGPFDELEERSTDGSGGGRFGTTRAGGVLGPLALVVASAALTAGSEYTQSPGCARYDASGYCAERKRFATPIYLDKASLREAVRVEAARPLDRIGQLHAIGSWLFVGERNRGVHVIDNTDPAVPVNVGFLRIPGNTEVAVRGTILYADSYVDLVTLDVSDPRNVRVVDRREDIFPFDAFQNVPYDIAFRYEDVDSSRGVVVGYEE